MSPGVLDPLSRGGDPDIAMGLPAADEVRYLGGGQAGGTDFGWFPADWRSADSWRF